MLSYLDNKMAKMTEKRQSSGATELRWGNMEKETLKKYLLNYGFGRWHKIQKKSA
jgi:hypothetical protein